MNKKNKKSLKRAAKKKKEKAAEKEAQNKMKKQMGMFSRLPKVCSTCEKEFPKTRAAHMTWRVVVSDEQVRLFCPACQEKTNQLAGGE